MRQCVSVCVCVATVGGFNLKPAFFFCAFAAAESIFISSKSGLLVVIETGQWLPLVAEGNHIRKLTAAMLPPRLE